MISEDQFDWPTEDQPGWENSGDQSAWIVSQDASHWITSDDQYNWATSEDQPNGASQSNQINDTTWGNQPKDTTWGDQSNEATTVDQSNSRASGDPPKEYPYYLPSYRNLHPRLIIPPAFDPPFDVTSHRFNNVPSRYETLIALGSEERKVSIVPETRVPNAAVFVFKKEDHTLANLLRHQLTTDSRVMFAAYKVPHPLFADFELRVQTDGSVTPRDALIGACRDVVRQLEVLGREFTKEWELKKITQMHEANGN